MRSLLVALVLLGTGCGRGTASAAGDTLTTRERHERIGTMPVPGARGVTRALEVQDSGAARARTVDSVAGEQ